MNQNDQLCAPSSLSSPDDFDKLCAQIEQSSQSEIDGLLALCVQHIIPALKEYDIDSSDGVHLLVSFMIASCYADGSVNQEEYELIHPTLQALFGDDLSIEDAKKAVDSFADDQEKLKAETDNLIDMLGELDEHIKMEIVTMCLIVCAVDHKISEKEKAYIKQLIA